jgi:MoaA/NifB/PqqE/SkfB family radical SAM enzyme
MDQTGTGLKETAARASRMLLQRPRPTEILWLNFAVTYLCNGKCRMCRIWEKYRQEPGLSRGELSLPEIESFLSSEYLQKLEGVGLTGGEPFLRRDFVDLVGLFVRRHPSAFVSIATNGLSPGLIARRTREIVERYHPRLLSVSISLDGMGAGHDRMRGVKGAFERVLQTIKSLREYPGINLGLDFTITPWNYADLWDAYELSKRLGIKFLAGFAHHSDFYYGNEQIAFQWDDRFETAADLLRRVARDRAATEPLLDKLVNPNAWFMAQAPEYESRRRRLFHCHSGVHSLFLDPHGDVYPCIILDEKVGNVRAEPLETLWLSSRAQEIRNGIQQQRCHCWVACEAVPSMLRSLTVPRWNLINKVLKPLVVKPDRHGYGDGTER